MPKRVRQQPNDEEADVIAARMVAQVTGSAPHPMERGKNPAAVALGRLGGLKGGKARAAKLSKKKRAAIAKKAAAARWSKR
jgi:hypothetical protein